MNNLLDLNYNTKLADLGLAMDLGDDNSAMDDHMAQENSEYILYAIHKIVDQYNESQDTRAKEVAAFFGSLPRSVILVSRNRTYILFWCSKVWAKNHFTVFLIFRSVICDLGCEFIIKRTRMGLLVEETCLNRVQGGESEFVVFYTASRLVGGKIIDFMGEKFGIEAKINGSAESNATKLMVLVGSGQRTQLTGIGSPQERMVMYPRKKTTNKAALIETRVSSLSLEDKADFQVADIVMGLKILWALKHWALFWSWKNLEIGDGK